MATRRVFSIRDLGIVVVVIVLLIGMLLPQVEQVREAANRTKSQNNIRQIGIAIQNYKDGNNQRYPLLVDWTPEGIGAPTGMGYMSLFFAIIPQMESSRVYGTFSNIGATANATYASATEGATKTIMKVYISPADPSSSDGDTATGVATTAPSKIVNGWTAISGGVYGTCSYAVNGLVFQPGTTEKSLTDGLTNTIFIAERYQKCYYGWGTGPTSTAQQVFNLWGMGSYSASMPSFCTPFPKEEGYPTSTVGVNGGITVVHALNQFYPMNADDKFKVDDNTSNSVVGKIGNTAVADFNAFNKSAGIQAALGFQVAPRGTVLCDSRVPQTPHVGGMIVGLGDASARTVSSSISSYTFHRACTPAGKEDLGTDW